MDVSVSQNLHTESPITPMKQIDDTFVSHIDNILNHEHETELEAKQPKENGPMLSEPSPGLLKHDDEIPELVKVALSMDRPKNERCSPGIVGPPVKLLLILRDTFHLSTLHLSYQEEVMIGVDVPKAILDIEDSFHRLNKVVGTHVAV
ncbi:hypothetical protein AAC387_Pa10g0715 [Persea americana]